MKRCIRILTGVTALSVASLGVAQAATVYIPEGSAGQAIVVDAGTDTVVGRIGGLPDVHGLGAAVSGRYLVAGSYAETSSDQMPAVDRPAGMPEDEHAAHHDAKARKGASSGNAVSILTIIDADDGKPVRRLEVPGAVHHVAVSPDGRYAVATHPNADGISVVDLSGLTVRTLLRTGAMPNYAEFSADGSRVYVSNAGDGTVSEIDVDRWVVRRDLPAGETPEHIVLAPDGRTLYVANAEAGAVSALAIEQGGVDRTFAVGGELHGLDISDDGDTLYVSGIGEDKVVAIDLPSGSMRTASLGPGPYHLAVIRGTGKLYVSSREEPEVWVVDEATLTPRGTIPVKGEAHQMVVLP
ncbi:YncE family protein [Microbaculum marinisediminis]|uniref:Beta-propeller fold lactonase family protein n=1 Tax=Microbaculum marinisediminis TaxID=2931392 RepID=A0AAW5QV03_9HYPH|nr:beta-propeller fold lactonase family protein [Microbaculum sp. A6E488]MCT8971523.1 beta-propeller fold lactonase family protein [Microbaculum sp. A6E488]